MRTAVKVLLWVVGSVTVLLLLGAGALAWGLSGGWDGIRPAAQPDDADVVEAREASIDTLARVADPVQQVLAEGTVPLGAADVDGCSPGQNNWKIQDGYTLQCSQALVVGVASTAGTLPEVTGDVDGRLRALGWVPASHGQLEVLASGTAAQGRYQHPDDPRTTLVVDVSAPGHASPYVSLGRYGSTWGEGDPQPVVDAVEASSAVTVLAVVQRTYFQDG